MELDIIGKVAIVTGSSGGIGAAIANSLAKEGVKVAIVYFRNGTAAEAVAQQIIDSGEQSKAFKCDVREPKEVQQLFADVHKNWGSIDILINCAGVARFNPLAQFTVDDWNLVMETNLRGTFLCCKESLQYFMDNNGGDIVNISSLSASTGSFEGGAYAASKAGINLLTLSLALELAPTNIRVNCIAPGRITTPFRRTTSGVYFDFMLDQTPQKRMGTPQEVAELVTFIASRKSAFITGETIYITGGLHTVYLNHVEPETNSPLRS